jgi:hypothetical protein
LVIVPKGAIGRGCQAWLQFRQHETDELPKETAMRAEELMELVKARPFTPLRIHLTDGQTYDITHPDLVLVLRQRVDIGQQPDPVSGVLERVAHCSLLHIVRVEPIPPGTAVRSAG